MNAALSSSPRPSSHVLVLVTSVESADVGIDIAHEIRRRGGRATVSRPHAGKPSATGFDAVIVGESWWSHWHGRASADYVVANCAALAEMPTAYFAVRGAHTAFEHTPGDDERFFRKVDWWPLHRMEVVRSVAERVGGWLAAAVGVRGPGALGSPDVLRFAAQLIDVVERS